MDFYEGYARFYDLDMGEHDEDLPMIEGFADRCGSPILELACGTGRVLLPLARRGYHVTGVDTSPLMLERARRKVVAEGLDKRVTLAEQDMRRLSLQGRYQMAVVATNSFMHMLTLDDQLAALAGMRDHLEPGGLLLLDLFNPDLDRLLQPPGRVELLKVMADPESGNQVIKYGTQRVDLGRQVIDTTYIVDEVDGRGGVRRSLYSFSMRYVFRGELELLLRHAGLRVEAIYGSWDLDDFNGDSPRMIAVAQRSG